MVTHMGRWFVFRWSATLSPQGDRVPALPTRFWKFLSIYEYILCHRTSRCHVVTHGKVACLYMVSHAPPQGGRVPVLPNFEGSFYLCVHPLSQNYQITHGNTCREGRVSWVLLYLCLHTLMQNDQIWHGNTYGEGCVFRRSATPLRLHKCVARFVSNS